MTPVTNEDLASQIALNTQRIEQLTEQVKHQNGNVRRLTEWRSYMEGQAAALHAGRAARAWLFPAVWTTATAVLTTAMWLFAGSIH